MNSINICLTCFDFTSAVSIYSIIKSEMKKNVSRLHFYIFLDDNQPNGFLVKPYIQKICNKNKCLVDYFSSNFINSFCKEHNFEPLNGAFLAYARLFLPKMLSNIKKIIYLDCDTLVLKPISKLWELDFPFGKSIGASQGLYYGKKMNQFNIPMMLILILASFC